MVSPDSISAKVLGVTSVQRSSTARVVSRFVSWLAFEYLWQFYVA